MSAAWLTNIDAVDAVSAVAAVVSGVLLCCWYYLLPRSKLASIPLVNGRRGLDLLHTRAKQRFVADAVGLMRSGFATSGDVFRLLTDNGSWLVLSPKFADDVRNDERLSFGKVATLEFHGELKGFEAFREGSLESALIGEVVRTKLTQALGRLTGPLCKETSLALQGSWTDNKEWHHIYLKMTMLQLVAQLSARVFVGARLGRNPVWQRITVDFAVESFFAAEALRFWPRLLRPVVHWVLPGCRKVRSQVAEAQSIICPELDRRRAARAEMRRQASPVDGDSSDDSSDDLLDWIEELAQGRAYDPATCQLGVSLAAIHTTSDLLTQAIFDICGRPQLIEDLRAEIVAVIQQDGWSKSSLYKLKLMDSVLKESQRLKPTSSATMRRVAMQDLTLPDGTKVPQGTPLMVSAHHMWTSDDDSHYHDAGSFDGYRFLRMRQQTGQENSWQLVSTSTRHLGFGLGRHACPGRFFAAQEAKIVLCHVLLKYDLDFDGKGRPSVVTNGISMLANPFARIRIRRRQEEMSLDQL